MQDPQGHCLRLWCPLDGVLKPERHARRARAQLADERGAEPRCISERAARQDARVQVVKISSSQKRQAIPLQGT